MSSISSLQSFISLIRNFPTNSTSSNGVSISLSSCSRTKRDGQLCLIYLICHLFSFTCSHSASVVKIWITPPLSDDSHSSSASSGLSTPAVESAK